MSSIYPAYCHTVTMTSAAKAISGEDSHDPVSYTHLDVYKRQGKWCSFNIAYLDRIFQEAKRVAFINHSQDEFALSKDDVIQFARENGFYDETNSRQPYETFYKMCIRDRR